MSTKEPTDVWPAPMPMDTAPRDGTVILAWSWQSEGWQAIKWHNEKWLTSWDHDPFSEPECWVLLPPPPSDEATP